MFRLTEIIKENFMFKKYHLIHNIYTHYDYKLIITTKVIYYLNIILNYLERHKLLTPNTLLFLKHYKNTLLKWRAYNDYVSWSDIKSFILFWYFLNIYCFVDRLFTEPFWDFNYDNFHVWEGRAFEERYKEIMQEDYEPLNWLRFERRRFHYENYNHFYAKCTRDYFGNLNVFIDDCRNILIELVWYNFYIRHRFKRNGMLDQVMRECEEDFWSFYWVFESQMFEVYNYYFENIVITLLYPHEPLWRLIRDSYLKILMTFDYARRGLVLPEFKLSNPKPNIYILTLLSFYDNNKTYILPLIISLIIGLILIDFYSINFLRSIAAWYMVGILFFWLISGFNLFLKKYRYGKFTSAIQRFWKRTNSYFWFIEGFLFLLFFYYYLNSSQEVHFFHDETHLNQNFLLSLPSFYFSSMLLIFMIFYSLFLLLNLSNLESRQLLTHLTVITLGLILIFLSECYQFYYIITFFFENTWNFSGKDNIWVLTVENPKIRVQQQYFIMALIAKYWHFLFIFFSWLFLVYKSYEQKKITYTLFGINLQNLILLLLLNMLFYVNWVKWIYRRFFDVIYYWFFTDLNDWDTNAFLEQIYLFTNIIYQHFISLIV